MNLDFCKDTLERIANLQLELLNSIEFRFCAKEDTICHT